MSWTKCSDVGLKTLVDGCRTNAGIYKFWGRIQRKTWCMDPGTELTITSPCVHSRVDSQHIYHGQPCSRVDLNHMPVSTLSPSEGLWIWPSRQWIETAVPILYVLCDQVKHWLMKGSLVKNVFSFIATFQCGILKPGLPNLFPIFDK